MIRRATALALLVLACAACGGEKEAEQAPAPPSQHFASRPDLRPPLIKIVSAAHDTAPGYIFIAPKKQVDQAGPLILDNKGNVIWFRTLDTKGVTDFRVQRYRGKPVLTWWRGETAKGIGNGRYVIMDSSYRVIKNVTAGNGLSGDIHEFIITPRDTALFTIYRKLPRDLSALGGKKDGFIQEGVVQEVDIASGRVLFEWHSAPHVALDESYQPLPKEGEDEAWDYFHINAIEPDTDGNLLVSARSTHTIYKISRRDGSVIWRLGGKKNDFELGPGVKFSWQHDPRRRPDGTLSIFDNSASQPTEKGESRAIVLRLDEQGRTATLVTSYEHKPPLLSTSQGNAQTLPKNHVFVGWGSNEYFTEFDEGGAVLLDAKFGSGGSDSYRAYRFPWVGRPAGVPDVALSGDDGGTVVSVSWNGATQVTGWRVLGGDDESNVQRLGEAPRTGFETRIDVPEARRYWVQALDGSGRVLATSKPASRD